jgi:hypothetical protein
MQYQVPQFIDSEDKVVGPFSLRQFLYVGVAAGISGICYFLVSTWLFFIVALILIGGALALSFVKINGRPLMKIGLSAFSFYWQPQTYVWKSPDAIPQTKAAAVAAPAPKAITLPPIEKIALGSALHKSWQNLQTGTPIKKKSDKQYIEKKMAERYQIFQRESGDRTAARRVDYR